MEFSLVYKATCIYNFIYSILFGPICKTGHVVETQELHHKCSSFYTLVFFFFDAAAQWGSVQLLVFIYNIFSFASVKKKTCRKWTAFPECSGPSILEHAVY